MMLTVSCLSEKQAKEVVAWNYEDPYSVYNLPAWEDLKRCNIAITNEEIRQHEFYSVTDVENRLIAYFRFVEKDNEVWIGVGIIPESCGQGLGKTIMKLIVKTYKKRYTPTLPPLVLDVRTFNKRAIKCYEDSGFIKIGDSYFKRTLHGDAEFIKMQYLNINQEI